MQAAIRLFGQGAAEDLLKAIGGRATMYELVRFMDQNYPGLLTHEMLKKALYKLLARRVIERDEQGYFHFPAVRS